jgi:hypothetical protein
LNKGVARCLTTGFTGLTIPYVTLRFGAQQLSM